MAPSRCANSKNVFQRHLQWRFTRASDHNSPNESAIFHSFLANFLRQCKFQDPCFILTQQVLTDTLASASTLIQTLLEEDSKRAVFVLSCGVASKIFNIPKDEEEAPIDTTEMEVWISAQSSNDQNVVFKCTFLVDVETCDTPCDFQTTTITCFSFSAKSFNQGKHLIVADNTKTHEYSAIVDFYVASPTRQKPLFLLKSSAVLSSADLSSM